jgi:hypothetical protein
MDKGKGCTTFLSIVFLILVVIIIVYLVAPELIDSYLPQPGESGWFDTVTESLRPFAFELDAIATRIGEFFGRFKLQ